MLFTSAASQAAHDPVILIPGMTGTEYNMYPMRDFLVRNGWDTTRVYPWTDADKMNKDMDASARAISAKVDSVLKETGARKVVIAAWSAGTIATRNYIKNYGGASKVAQFISIAGPHHGISNFGNCFPSVYPACANQWGPIPYTAWMSALTSGTEVPGWPNVRYLTMRGTADTNAIPVDTAMLTGADENALFQGLNHNTLITDNAPLTKMRDFIIKWEQAIPTGPVVTACSASVSGSTATVRATGDDSNGPIVSYRVRLSGPTGVDDAASVSGTSLSRTYTLADGLYTGTVTATDNSGRTSAECQISRFSVGQAMPTEHDPVIVMTGASGDLSKSRPMVDYLLANGWKQERMFHWKDSTGFQGDVAKTAAEIRTKVDDVLRTTGASKVVLVTWSSSTVSGRYYVKNLGGNTKVSQFISIAGPHHGIKRFMECQYLWVSCSQWGPIPLTQFMLDLNVGTEVPGWPAVRYLTLRGSVDTNASPVDTAILAGADENVLYDGLDHYTLITDPRPQAKVRDFILAHETTGGGGDSTIPTNLAVTSFTSTSVSLAWNGVTNASGYNVYFSTSSSGPWSRANGSSPIGGTMYTVNGLTAGTTYYFMVRAQKSDGTESANSSVVSQNTGGTGGGDPYSEKVTAPVYTHYTAGRVNYTQYITLGTRYGYATSVTLYHCGTTWTDKSNCAPL